MQTEEVIKALKADDLCPFCTKHPVYKHCVSTTCNWLRCSFCHLNFDPLTGRANTDK